MLVSISISVHTAMLFSYIVGYHYIFITWHCRSSEKMKRVGLSFLLSFPFFYLLPSSPLIVLASSFSLSSEGSQKMNHRNLEKISAVNLIELYIGGALLLNGNDIE